MGKFYYQTFHCPKCGELIFVEVNVVEIESGRKLVMKVSHIADMREGEK